MSEIENILNVIKNDAIRKATQQGIPKSNLYIDVGVFNAGDVINAGQQIINVPKPSIMVFADDDPLHNWSHPCRYILYDAMNGSFIEEINARFPPHMTKVPSSYSPFFQPITHSSSMENLPPLVQQPKTNLLFNKFGGQRFAVLFSGASEYRHVNDLQYLYNQLTGVYKFLPENIYVLNYDGTTAYSSFTKPVDIFPIMDVPYSMPVNAAGTQSELNNVFDELKSRLKPDDLLFILTDNHGDGPIGNYDTGSKLTMGSSLCTYSPPGVLINYPASEFADTLGGLPKFAQLIVLMEQCHSGGFALPIISKSPAEKTCFMASCQYDQCSLGGLYFDPFVNTWTAGISGVDESFNNTVELFSTSQVANSVQSAFNSAKNCVAEDIPVMSDSPSGCGSLMVLGSA